MNKPIFKSSNTQWVVLKFQINWHIITEPMRGKTEPNELTGLLASSFLCLAPVVRICFKLVNCAISIRCDKPRRLHSTVKTALCNVFFVTQHRTC